MRLLRIVIAALVAVVWSVVYLASVFNPEIAAPAELSGVMLAVVTWLFGTEVRAALRDRAHNAATALAAATAGGEPAVIDSTSTEDPQSEPGEPPAAP